ncbi:1-phosphofructokinase family hexose kinase [Hydrogenophaga sp.]|uniref:1-phosphofructokinase family hexose kinase n=1 Tax=Hydrogenophaga sp. TaxID=1904254 RepID=UPI0025C5EDD7|nr:1-phosphofructokinase family hexose kinase [Hydrogenophaga sp.]
MPSTATPLRVLCLTMNPSVDLATRTLQVVPTHKLRCDATQHDAGGGGVNVARVLTRLGGTCQALCPAGGPSGEWLKQRMADEGLLTTYLPLEGETRVSFTVHEAATGSEFRFVMPGPALSDAEWRGCLQHLSDLDDFPDLLVASGSLPPGVPVDFYAQVAQLCQARGGRLVLDGSGPALAAALAEGVYLVKPNLRELVELAGQPLESTEQWQAAARGLVETGSAEVVALTLGHLGAVLVTREGVWTANALPVKVVSAVGAGDSFVGGLVWALQQGQTMLDAFAWGMSAGTGALLSASTGLCCAEDAVQLRGQVHLHRLTI